MPECSTPNRPLPNTPVVARGLFATMLVYLGLGLCVTAAAQPSASPPPSPSDSTEQDEKPAEAEDFEQVERIQDSAAAREFIRSLAARHIPAQYEDKRDWGHTRRVTTGVKVSLDGLRIDSERRVKQVNHGTWKRYRIDRQPGDDSLELAVERVEQREDGTLHVDLACTAKLLVSGRWAHWERGVQLTSIGMESDAKVRLSAGCDIRVDLNPLKIPPDVTLRPQVTNAKLDLVDFRLRRLGALEGPVVKQFGEALEEILQDRIRDENRQLADKLNRQLAKKPDRFRFSLQDWASRKWESLIPRPNDKAATPGTSTGR